MYKTYFFGFLTALLCTFALVPLAAGAVGFAPQQSLFLSKASVIEGETVVIHAVVNNDGTDPFAGKMRFKNETGVIGSVSISLKSGEAVTVSTSWQPNAGVQSVTADLISTAGVIVGSETESFTINPKPEPAIKANTSNSSNTSGSAQSASNSDNSASVVESSAPIQKSIANLSPATAKTVAPVFSIIDAGRTSTAGALDGGISWSKKQLAQTAGKKSSTILNKTPTNSKTPTTTETTSGINTASIMNTLWTILATVSLFVLSALRYLVANAGLFYPFLLVLFFYILWRMFRRIRRPSY